MNKIDYSTEIIEKPSKCSSLAERAVWAADALGDYKASLLVRIIAQAHEVNVVELFYHSRCRAPIAMTRQIAMYMMHVVVGRNLTDVGRFFGRDRTTVSHACSRIEDLRDDLKFDEEMDNLEEQFTSIMNGKTKNISFVIGVQANDK